jgi:uncharacterized membrane protein YccF (DUF307 family)
MVLSGSVSVILTSPFGGFLLGVGMALSGSVSVILTSAFGGFILGVGMVLSTLVLKIKVLSIRDLLLIFRRRLYPYFTHGTKSL